MGKLASLLLATLVVGLLGSSAEAGRRSRGCPCGYGQAAMTTAAPVPAPSTADVPSPQTGATQSYSYEPAVQTAPIAAAPVVYQTVRPHRVYEPGRADNKARGIYPGVLPSY